MRKIIAGINMTLDGIFDHTAVDPDEEIHQHYADLLHNADVILYGRITYQLMEYWKAVVKKPTGDKSTDEFAIRMDNIPKIVFSRTLKSLEWETARLADRAIEEEVLTLKQSHNGEKDILVGSRSLIISLMKLNLIDELQLCVHPVIAGQGLPLFENMNDRIVLKLLKMKTFSSGAVIFYYEPSRS